MQCLAQILKIKYFYDMKIFSGLLLATLTLSSTSAMAYVDDWRRPNNPAIEIFAPFKTDTAIQDFLFSGNNPFAGGKFTGMQEYRTPRYEILPDNLDLAAMDMPPQMNIPAPTANSSTVLSSRSLTGEIPEPTPIQRAVAPVTPLQYSAFKEVADRAIISLAKGNPDPFLDNVSPNMKEYFSEARIVNNTLTQVLPYFQTMARLEDQARVARTVDSWGNEGFSFYRTFVTRTGETRNFLIQIVKEDNRLVIANLTPDLQTDDRNISQRVSSNSLSAFR